MNFQGFAIAFCRIIWVSFRFLEFSRNCLAVKRDPSGDTSYRPSFLGFPMNRLAAEHDPLGDANWVAQFLVVLGIFGLPMRSQW